MEQLPSKYSRSAGKKPASDSYQHTDTDPRVHANQQSNKSNKQTNTLKEGSDKRNGWHRESFRKWSALLTYGISRKPLIHEIKMATDHPVLFSVNASTSYVKTANKFTTRMADPH